ncbi:HEAT repeat domain-containing protein [Aporhodopirellula aestuarii]|uniref:HEAT repeat domain-containing protein n=1 Tax=Aporhodopirellula aestuarii TaxID=2950107 RepID=A0ABT0U663_9BACT|nr:HEAT repeat domain-containing protein [Aporhodopirellula aestuarii]MCM2372336.1 HEAT repeat domain-containing protein [Aporhodopirellula aestuarii]
MAIPNTRSPMRASMAQAAGLAPGILFLTVTLAMTAAASLNSLAVDPTTPSTQEHVIDGKPLDYWLRTLQSSDSDAKSHRAAATALGKLQAENAQVLETLSSCVRSGDRWLRLAAILGLKHQGSAAVPVLREQLGSADQNIQVAALKTLGQLGPSAISALPDMLKLIEDEKEFVYIRQNAVQCLAAIESGQSAQTTIDRLHALLRNEQNKPAEDYWKHAILRHRIVGALPRLGPHAEVAIPTLIEMLEHPVRPEKRYLKTRGAPSALGLATPILRQDDKGTYTDPSDIETMYVIGSLAEFGPAANEALPILRQLSKDPAMLAATREMASKAIERIAETKVKTDAPERRLTP